MKKNTLIILIFSALLISSKQALAQAVNSVAMADAMRDSGKIYVVIAVIALVFAGIVAYLLRIENKIGKIEKELAQRK